MRKAVILTILLIPALAVSQVAPVTNTVTPQAGGVLIWVQNNLSLVFGVLWGLCETLSLIPSVKSSSVFTLVFNTLQKLHNNVFTSTPPKP